MNIRKFLNRVKGKEKLEAFREAARYCETALPPQPAPEKEPLAQGRLTTDVTFEKTPPSLTAFPPASGSGA